MRMMEGIYEIGKTIIRDGRILFPEVIETDMACRAEEQPIIDSLSLLMRYKPSGNFFIYGPSGSGKTAMAKHILSHASERSRNILCLYVNCWHHGSSMVIYTKIAEALHEPVSRRGRASDEIFDRILLLLKKARMPVLLVLDEIEGLTSKGDTRILHNIADSGDFGVNFCVIGISDTLAPLSKLDTKTYNALGFRHVKVQGYTKEQLLELLRIKARKSLAPGSYDEGTLEEMAEMAASHGGNARIAIKMLREASINAERRGKQKIQVPKIGELGFREDLNAEECIIRDILWASEKTSSELYLAFCEKLHRTKRQIRNYLRSMQAKGIIELETVMVGNRPKHTLIRLRDGFK